MGSVVPRLPPVHRAPGALLDNAVVSKGTVVPRPLSEPPTIFVSLHLELATQQLRMESAARHRPLMPMQCAAGVNLGNAAR